MRKIIVIAYQLHYKKGSEYSVAWNYAKYMSRNNKLVMLYGTSGEYHQIGETSEMEEYCRNHIIENVSFIPIRPSFHSKQYDYSLRGQYLFYKEYRKWHEEVRDFILDLIKKERFDLIHFLGPIGYREPGYSYKYPIPYIWGPVGGFGGADPCLLKATCSFKGAIHMFLKRTLNDVQSLTDKRVKKALRFSDVVICATTEYQRIITKIAGKGHHSKILYLAENCIANFYDLNKEKFSQSINIAFIGRIDENKGLIFLLEALNKLGNNINLNLDVVGEDRLGGKMQEWAKTHHIDHMITWHGLVPRDEVFEILNNSHLVAITSLHEGNPTIVWEAMSVGTPILTLDYKGMHDIVSKESGFKIKVHSYNQIVNDIAIVLKEIIDNKKILREKADLLMKERELYSWERRMLFFEDVYKLAEEQFNRRDFL